MSGSMYILTARPDRDKKADLIRVLALDNDVFVSEPPLTKYSEHAFDSWRELHHPDVCEVISRPMANSRPWMASKRDPQTENGTKMEGEVHLELMGTDSSLVDVDRALSKAHSAWWS